MKKKKLYLDTSILIAEFNKKDQMHSAVNEFFKYIAKIKDVELCTSKWALTELYNKLSKSEIKELKIVKYIKDVLDRNKIRTQALKVLDVHPRTHYSFHDFFNDLAKDLIKYKTGNPRPSLGDIMHIRIMKNQRIKHIITLDSDFEKIQGIICLNLRKSKTLP